MRLEEVAFALTCFGALVLTCGAYAGVRWAQTLRPAR